MAPGGGIDPALVEEELAEHERWGSAAGTVGGAGSADRAGWIAEQVGGGLGAGLAEGAIGGLVLSLGGRGLTRALARRIPVPIIGNVIGGAIGAWGLAGQLASAKGLQDLKDKIGAIGTGASDYEIAANTIEGIVTILDLAANVLDTVALVCGVVAAIAWAAAIPTLGASTPVATSATALGVAVGTGAAALTVLKTGLQPMVLLFRSLHAFTDEADPREVQVRGGQLNAAASAVGGVLGGFAGTAGGNRFAERAGMPANPANAVRFADRSAGRLRTPGEGPVIEAIRPASTTADAGPLIVPPDHRPPAPAPADGGPLIVPPDYRPPAPVPADGGPLIVVPGQPTPRPDAHLFGPDGRPIPARPAEPEPSVIINEEALGLPPGSVVTTPGPPRPKPAGPDTDVDWVALTGKRDPTVEDVRAALPKEPRDQLGYTHDLLVDPAGRPMAPTKPSWRGEQGMAVRDPHTGELTWKPEARLVTPPSATPGHATFVVRMGGPHGDWVAQHFTGPREVALAQAQDYARQLIAGGEARYRDDSALPYVWKGDEPRAQEFAINVYEIPPPKAAIESVVAPQPEGAPAPGRRDVYPGGGPQTQLPPGAIAQGRLVSTHDGSGTQFEMNTPTHRAGRAAEQARERRVLGGPTLDRWDDATDAAQFGSQARPLVSPDRPARTPGYAAGGDALALVRPGAGEPGDVERIVERVNPDYEAPPGTPEQLANAREAIRVALATQAQARADAGSAAKDRAVTRRRQGQLDDLDGNLGTLAERTTEQRQFTTSTVNANREQQKRQEGAGTDLAGSASRFAGMATLGAMLAGWADGAPVAATIVGVFSDDGANKIRKSGGDARRFLSQLNKAKLVVDEQRERQPLRMNRLAGDQASLTAEGQRGAATYETNQGSVQQLALIRSQNSQDEQAAGQAEDRAQADATESGRTAADLQGRHDQLSAALQAWAQRHAEQRRVAVAKTCDRLRSAGYEVVNVPTQ